MTGEAIAWGAIFTVFAGTLSYLIKKYIDWRVDRGIAGQLDVLREKQVKRFHTIVRIEGMLAEIDHCMNHLKNDDFEYSQKCKGWCMKVRQEARASIALLGEDTVHCVTTATDVAIKYLDERCPTKLYDLWKERLSQVNTALKVLN